MDKHKITIEKMKEALNGFKSFKIEPYKAFYCNYNTQNKILRHCYNQPYPEIILVGGIDLYIDNDIEEDIIIYCEPGLFAKWKELKNHPWIDKNDTKIDLWKVASSLFESDKKPKKSHIDISWTFTPGEKFPTGANITGFKVDKLDFPPIKFENTKSKPKI